MVLIIPANFQLLPESKSPIGHWSCSAGGQWTHTYPRAWSLVGGWAGSCIPEPHPHTLKPCLVKLIWDTFLRGSSSTVLCRTRPLLNRQRYHVRINCLEALQVTELEPGVIWGNFSWLINSNSHLRKTEHLTTAYIPRQLCSFPAHEAFTPGLSANESDFHHHHLYLTCKIYSAGKTCTWLKTGYTIKDGEAPKCSKNSEGLCT